MLYQNPADAFCSIHESAASRKNKKKSGDTLWIEVKKR